MSARKLLLSTLLTFAIFAATTAGAEDWPKYRRDYPNSGHSAENGTLANGAQALRDSIAWAHANVDEALEYAMRYGRGIDKETCRKFVLMYVNDFTVALGKDGRAAIDRLFAMARDKGLIREVPLIDPV